jgi:hypothetical protein
MGILDGLQPPKFITSCKVRTIAETLDKADLDVFLKCIADEDAWKPTTLAEALSHRGIMITKDPIQKHRTGRCSCSKI